VDGAPVEPETGSVLTKTADEITTITLNRPDRLNAFTPGMRELYLAALDRADRDPGVRAIVVTGAGRAFCAGADFTALDGLDAETIRARAAVQPFPFDTAMRLRKPLIAAVNGPVAGIGLVQWIVPAGDLLDRARAYAAALAGNSAYSLARMREQVHAAWEQDWRTAYERSQALVYESLDRPEFAELAASRSARRTASRAAPAADPPADPSPDPSAGPPAAGSDTVPPRSSSARRSGQP
jgi:enoyl-CoA hydratase/carnithine racemase